MCDCKYRQKHFLPKTDRIIVIGDLHSDYENTVNLFKKFKLINNNLQWIASPKNTHVVQLGDQIDGKARGIGNDAYGELKILDFIDNINQQAQLYGGGVYSLLGNHELMNIMGNFSYVSQKDMNLTKQRYSLFRPGGSLACRLACTRSTIIKIGSFLFVHAGVNKEHIRKYSRLDSKAIINKINQIVYDYISNKTYNNQEIDDIFLDKNSMLWTREYGRNTKCSDVNDVLNVFDVGYMIVGHTPQNDGINSVCDNKIWRVDIGLSKIFGINKIEVLEILNDGISCKSNNFKPIRILS